MGGQGLKTNSLSLIIKSWSKNIILQKVMITNTKIAEEEAFHKIVLFKNTIDDESQDP